MLTEELKSQIESLLSAHRVVLFMKGSKHFPQCGFSGAVVQVLNRHGVPYETVNVLQSAALREGIKHYTNWPTIPQLYVDGEFIGGCDIVRELDAKGELAEILKPTAS